MNINLCTSLTNTGYGIAGRKIALELIKYGNDVRIIPYGGLQADSQEEANLIVDAINKGKFFHHEAPCINMWHQFALDKRFGHGKFFGFPIFELDKFNELEIHHLNYPNELIVTCQWAKKVIENNGVQSKIHTVPLGVDTSVFFPDLSRNHSIRDNPEQYIFLNIGKWEVRKGHDLIPNIFCKAFNKKDNVKLIMVPNNPFLNEQQINEWNNRYQQCELSDKISLLQPVETHQQIAQIINECNCGLFPARAEGWNMELLEIMACGKSVITTNYSAHTEYCNKQNSFLVDIPNTELANDGMWFNGQGKWAEIDYDEEEQFIEYMKHCYKERPSNPEGILTAHKFTWKNSADKLLDIIKNR